MITEEIQKELYRLQDEKYRDFQGGLIPSGGRPSGEAGFSSADRHVRSGKAGRDVSTGEIKMIGVRTPALRAYAKELSKREDIHVFLEDLPHTYFDENQLHAFIISEIRDYDLCLAEVSRFLPYVDNWATCDQMSPKVFKKHRMELLEVIRDWIASNETYTIRFGIKMLMMHFLEEDFAPEYPEMVAGVRSEEYYVNMMIAWYFATALAKQWDAIIPYIENNRLENWTHNKAIQKAVESYRITPEQKDYLRGLRMPRQSK